MANSDQIEWQLLDTDLTTVLAILPSANSTLYIQLNQPGSGALKIPIDSAAAGQVSYGQFCRCHYRGAIRGGFFIENIVDDDASSSEGKAHKTLSGRGTLALLDEAIVWDDGSVSSTRNITNTMAGVIITLIDEAIVRGAITNVVYDFSATVDTDSVAWSDSADTYELTVGKSLLETLRKFSDRGIDFDIELESNGTFTLHAYNGGLGSDLSESIYFRIGQNCTEVSQTALGEVKNAIRSRYKYGFSKVQDAASIAAYRRREVMESMEYAGTSSAALSFGNAKLALVKDPTTTISVSVTDEVSPNIFIDYGLGDTIVLDKAGTETDYRIRALGLSWGEAFAEVELDLNSSIKENEIRMALDVLNLKELWTRLTDTGLPITQFWAAITNDFTGSIISAIASDGNYIYFAGTFTKIGGVLANNIAGFDISTGNWVALGSGTNGAVYTLTHDGTNLWAGGVFTLAGGVSVSYFAKWDGTNWSNPGGGVTGWVYELAMDGTDVIIASNSTVGPSWFVQRWNGAAYSNVGDGLDGRPRTVAVNSTTGDIVIGGEFVNCISTALNYVAILNGAVWDNLGTGVDDEVYAIAFAGNNIYAGGLFLNAGGSPAARVAYWDTVASTWNEMDGGVNNTVLALETSLTDVFVGGVFTVAGDTSAVGAAKWNGGSWEDLQFGTSGQINDIHVYSAQVIAVGGIFTYAGGKQSPKAALYITTLEEVLNYLGNESSTGPGGPEGAVQYKRNGKFAGELDMMYDVDTGNILFGDGLTIAEAATLGLTNKFLISGDGEPRHPIQFLFGDYWPKIQSYYAKGSKASPTLPLTNNPIYERLVGEYLGTGDITNNANWLEVANMRALATQDHTTTAKGTAWEFTVTQDDTETQVVGLRVDGEGIKLPSGGGYYIDETPVANETPDGSPGKYLGADGAYHSLPVNLSLFLDDTNSGIAGYESLVTTNPAGAGTSVAVSITADDTAIEEFAAPANTFDFISEQVLHAHMHLEKTGGTKTATAYVEVYHRTSGGTETLMGTSAETSNIPSSKTEFDIYVSVSDTAFAATDIFVLKVLGNQGGAGTDPEVTLYFEGLTTGRVEIGTNAIVVGGSWDGDITDIDVASSADIGAAIADADQGIIYDASATAWVRFAWSRVKTYVQALTDTLYAPINSESWVLIEDKNLTGGTAASFDFTSIPTTYKQLKLIVSARSDRAAYISDQVNLKYNNDTGNNYITRIQWAGGNVEQNTAGGVYGVSYVTAASSPANWFSNFELTIPDYANTNKLKSWQSRGMQATTTGASALYIYDAMGMYLSTTAISRITLLPNAGTNFVQHSRASLYGLK